MTIQEIKDRGLLLFECISGSRAYGLDTPSSDTDLKGVYYLPKEQFFGSNPVHQVNNETNDEVYYELGRFVELLSKNNPNILEILATPSESVLYRHPIMDHLTIDLFLSKLCKDTFAGYATTQIRKAKGLKKKFLNPIDKERKSVLDFCFILDGAASIALKDWLTDKRYQQECCGLCSIPHSKGIYALYYDHNNNLRYKGILSGKTANELSLSSIPKEEKVLAYLIFQPDTYSIYCREYREYWEWVAKRNDTRYQGNQAHGKNYDAKNMMHTIRLLQVALEILTTGKLHVKRPNRDQLLAIKSGQLEYEDLLTLANNLAQQIESASVYSLLPDTANVAKIEEILISMRTELYS